MLKKVLPFLNWFEKYDRKSLQIDFVSGLTVALVLIPQSMAYAQLAGLPPYYGLYASFLPPMIASLFGSSRQLATGPVAVVSLMTSASLEPLATAGSEGYIAYAILLALMVGLLQFAIGLFRLGLVVNLLSHPVVNGFTNAAAIIIASSQLSKIFGVYVDKAEHHYETIIAVVDSAFHFTHWPTFFMGVLAFAIMYGLKRTAPRVPNVLVAVVVTTVISWAIGLEHDREADLSSIRSAEVRNLVRDFNATVEAIPELSQERAEVNARLNESRKNHDVMGTVDLEHDARVVSLKIEHLKEQAHVHRERIRALLMKSVEGEDGALAFYLEDEAPGGGGKDGRTWRIKVGNNPIPTDRITMMGGGDVVAVIPRGLPTLSMPAFGFDAFMHLLPFAAIIALLGFMEAISIAKAMAAKTGQRLDPNQELIGQGLANILGSVGKSYPTSGSFSRSAVNLQAGAVSGLSSVFTSLAVVVVLLFMTPLMYHLPQSVLAAVIMMAVIGLINVSGFVHAWRAQWYDGAISIVTFVCTLGFAPHLDRGIVIGVALSLTVFFYKSMRPVVASLSRHEDRGLRSSMFHRLQQCEYIDLIRFEGPLFFANASYLEDQISNRMKARNHLKHIIIAAHGINDMDASGEEALSLVIENVRSAGVDISFSGLNDSVMGVLKRTHLLEKIGEDHIHPTMEAALAAVHPTTHEDGEEDECPLTRVVRLI